MIAFALCSDSPRRCYRFPGIEGHKDEPAASYDWKKIPYIFKDMFHIDCICKSTRDHEHFPDAC